MIHKSDNHGGVVEDALWIRDGNLNKVRIKYDGAVFADRFYGDVYGSIRHIDTDSAIILQPTEDSITREWANGSTPRIMSTQIVSSILKNICVARSCGRLPRSFYIPQCSNNRPNLGQRFTF